MKLAAKKFQEQQPSRARLLEKAGCFGKKLLLEERGEVPLAQKPPQPKFRIAKAEKKPGTYLTLIDIAIDSYDDLFSDFDPSPYSTRALSVDLLKEVSTRYRETKEGSLQIRIAAPKKLRSTETEKLFKQRLKEHYLREAQLLAEGKYKLFKKGVLFAAAGLLFYTVYPLIPEPLKPDAYTLKDMASFVAWKVLGRIADISSYVSAFLGIEMMLYSRGITLYPESRKKEDINEKLGNAEIIFMSLEEIVKKVEETAKQETKHKDEKKEEKKEKGTDEKKTVLTEENKKRIIDFAGQQLSQNDEFHRIPHATETAKFALEFAKAENADGEVCWTASMLHDICKDRASDHGTEGANQAKHFLLGLGLPNDFVEKVADAIRYHNKEFKEGPIERKIVWDADKFRIVCPETFQAQTIPYNVKKYGKFEGQRTARGEYFFFYDRFHSEAARKEIVKYRAEMEDHLKKL